MSNAITAGEAYVKVSVDCKELVQGLQEASTKIKEAAREVSAAAPDLSPTIKIDPAPAKAALTELRESVQKTAQEGKRLSDYFVVTAGDVAHFIQGAVGALTAALGATGDKFDKMSQRVGVSVETLSEYAHAASMCGADLSNVEGALRSMASLTLNANNGVKKSSDTFKRLGVDLAYFNTLDTERQFEYLAEKIATIPDPTLRAAEAMKVFGTDGQRLLPLFNSGPDGLRQLREEARELGATFDEASAKMGADYVDATTRMREAVVGVGNAIAKALAPSVISGANCFAQLVAQVSQFIRDHPVITRAILGLTVGVGSFALGITAASKITAAWTTSLNQLKAAADVAKTAVVGLSRVVVAHPYLAVAAAIAAVVAGLYALSQAKAPKFHDEATSAYDQGENDRRDDKAAVRELEELRKKQKLSNEEIVRASELVAQLRSRYGEVGYQVDAVTGKITAQANAQEALNKKMAEARARELQAAIKERQTNLDTDAIGAKMRKEEVGFFDIKQRNVGWWDAIKNTKFFDSEDDRRKFILEHDDKFQARLKAARDDEQAAIDAMKAELETLNVQLKKPDASFAEVDESVFSDLSEFIKKGTKEVEKSVEESCQDIDAELARFGDALAKLADPAGEMNGRWDDFDARNRFFRKNPAAEGYYNQYLEARASAEAQKNELLDRQRKEREETEKKIAEQESRAAEAYAERQKKVWLNADARREGLQERLKNTTNPWVADQLRRQLARVDVDVERDKQIDAINKETEAYKKQLQAVIDLEEAKRETDPSSYDFARVERMRRSMQEADVERARQTAKVRAEADAKQQEKEQTALQGAFDRIFDKFASPFEKLQKAGQELQASYAALVEARESQDGVVIANALDRLGESQEKYLSAQEAASNVGSAVKSPGGTFNAWQAASLTSQINYDKQLYNETRAQTRYLIDIARNTRENAATYK